MVRTSGQRAQHARALPSAWSASVTVGRTPLGQNSWEGDSRLGYLWPRLALGWAGHLLASWTVVTEHIYSYCTREGLHRMPVTMCGTYTVPHLGM